MIDENGVKRDTRPDASGIFMAMLTEKMAAVLVADAESAGLEVFYGHTEHRSTRGIKLFTCGVA